MDLGTRFRAIAGQTGDLNGCNGDVGQSGLQTREEPADGVLVFKDMDRRFRIHGERRVEPIQNRVTLSAKHM